MRVMVLSVLFLASLSAAEITVEARRVGSAPLLAPFSEWSKTGAFNPAAARIGGRTVLLVRSTDGSGTSRIGYAESPDGKKFTPRPEPSLVPQEPYEKDGGVEDPRLVQIDGTWYLTYTGYNKKDAQLCLATSRDLIHWERKGVILPAYKGTWNTGWTKSGAIVPEKIHGRWWMYYLGTRKDSDGKERDYMGVATSTDLLHWTDASPAPVLERRPGAFDSRVMEPGPAPLVTPAGILLLYNGADDKLVYGPGWVLFDRNDPSKVLARSDKPFLLPQLEWEKVGVVPNVIFLEGALVESRSKDGRDWRLTGYYGGADKYVGAMDIRIRIR